MATLNLHWPQGEALHGEARLPASKSVANRLLVLGAQRPQFALRAGELGEDTQVFTEALRQLSYDVAHSGEHIQLTRPRQFPAAPQPLDLGAAGTAARFLTALCCVLPVEAELRGRPRLHQRPIASLFQTLRRAGANIEFLERDGRFPVRIRGQEGWQPSDLRLDSRASSQFLTALLLLGPSLPVGTSLELRPPIIASPAYAELTRRLLAELGLEWAREDSPKSIRYELRSKRFDAEATNVEPDWSAAVFPLAMLALRGGELHLPGLREDSPQGDAYALTIFRRWGMSAHFDGTGLAATNRRGNLLRPFQLDFTERPDLAQAFAVLAAMAEGESLLTGLHTLPHKETDRLAALREELSALGIEVEAGTDWLRVVGARPAPTRAVKTYDDHRMAMSFSLLAAAGIPLAIDAPEVVSKSFPGFWAMLRAFGAEVNEGIGT